MKEHPDYEHIRAFKDAHAFELLEKYGAHSIGIRRNTESGETAGRPVLTLYLDPNRDRSQTEPVPPYFDYQPSPGEAVVRIPAAVIDSAQAEPE